MKKILFFLLSCITFMSCGHFHDEPTKSVWAGGLWILPWLTAIGSVIFGVLCYKSSTSGSEQQDKNPGSPTYGQMIPVQGNTLNKGFLFFFIVLAIATVVIIIYQNSQI